MPFATRGGIAGYVEALDHLKGLNAEVYVSGHGALAYGSKAPSNIKRCLGLVCDSARKTYGEGVL